MSTTGSSSSIQRYALTSIGRSMSADLERDPSRQGELERVDQSALRALVHGGRTVSELRAALGSDGGTRAEVLFALERLVQRHFVRLEPLQSVERVIDDLDVVRPGPRDTLEGLADMTSFREFPRSPTIQFARRKDGPAVVLGERRIGSIPLREAIMRIGPAGLSLDDLAMERDRISSRASRRAATLAAAKTSQPRHKRDLDRWADDGGEVIPPKPEAPPPSRDPEVDPSRDPGVDPSPNPEVSPPRREPEFTPPRDPEPETER